MSDDPLAILREVTSILTRKGGVFEIENADTPAKRAYAGTSPDLNSLFARCRAEHGQKAMLESAGQRLTYEMVFAGADRLAAGLAAAYGIEPGDRIGLAMHNCADWFAGFFALQQLGAVATLFNSRSAADELGAAAQGVGCRLILADDRCAERLAGQSGITVIGPDGLRSLINSGAPSITAVHLDSSAPAMILFTSGTTGRPKGATLTHHNLCVLAREIQMRSEQGLLLAAQRVGQPVDTLRAAMPRPSMLMIVPMFHISGVTNLLVAATSGALMTLMRRWDPQEALDIIERHKIANLVGPSLIFSDLLAIEGAAERMRSVRSIAIGGQATPAGLATRWRAALPGCGVGGGWGMTESTGAATGASPAVLAAYPGTVGTAGVLVDLRIVGPDGEPLGAGNIGEIELRGPMVMRGYWNNDEANRATFRDSWLRTGDLGRLDEQGLLYIADRAKDMVISAGENIYCAEVERVLSMIEHQREVALFGVPDERLGERAIAAVVLREDAAGSTDADNVRRHVRVHLADYKVPAEVHFDLGPLPRNDLGKVNKAELARRYHERASQ